MTDFNVTIEHKVQGKKTLNISSPDPEGSLQGIWACKIQCANCGTVKWRNQISDLSCCGYCGWGVSYEESAPESAPVTDSESGSAPDLSESASWGSSDGN